MIRQWEQCACGATARVELGELIPDDWHHLPRSGVIGAGRLVCPRCWQEWWQRETGGTSPFHDEGAK